MISQKNITHQKSQYRFKAIIALGSNRGLYRNTFNQAINDLFKIGNVIARSRLYYTKPFGHSDQKNFYNFAIEIHTNYFFPLFFNKIELIERKLKKNKKFLNGPRRLDIDLIFFDNIKAKNSHICLPHISYSARDFVIEPIIDLLTTTKNFSHLSELKKFRMKLKDRYIMDKSRYHLGNLKFY